MVRKYWKQTTLLILALALPIAAQTVTISPTSATVVLDATRQFTKSVTGNANTNVTWTVNGLTGGNSTVGTISTTGLYTPPATLPPNPATIKVRAIIVVDTAKFAEANVSLQNPTPTIATVEPTDLNIGNTTLILKGTKYFTGAEILLQNAAVATQFISSTELRASVSLPNAQQYCVIVKNPAPAAANCAKVFHCARRDHGINITNHSYCARRSYPPLHGCSPEYQHHRCAVDGQRCCWWRCRNRDDCH